GTRAGLSLGVVGTGAFGHEPTYPSVNELAFDVTLARHAGIDDLALFDLGGVLARNAEVWLEAFTTAPASAFPVLDTARAGVAFHAFGVSERVISFAFASTRGYTIWSSRAEQSLGRLKRYTQF